MSLQALLSAPEPDDPQDAVVASVYKKDYREFERTAKYWTESYAKVCRARRGRRGPPAFVCARTLISRCSALAACDARRGLDMSQRR